MTVRIVVQGRVQGVGFRYFVARKAEELGVTGRVWNRADRAVELEATGTDEQLGLLEASLSYGPGNPMSVHSVVIEPRAFEGFHIDRSPPG